jgi:voltage-dependent calcium channel alpha-2/delta-3
VYFKNIILCFYSGYYVPLSTLAEVREQVLHYIPVMARPMVLKKTEHPINWTPVYADIAVSIDIKLHEA